MTIYSIDTHDNRKVVEDYLGKNILLGQVKDIHRNLDIDYNFMTMAYGFALTEPEIDQFYSHYLLWDQFYKSGMATCFIVEDLNQLACEISEVFKRANSLFEKNDKWDIYFPFDPQHESNFEYEIGYLLGYRWGAEGYFLKRAAANLLLQINTIKQTVDAEIIKFSSENKLEIAFGKTEFFNQIVNAECMRCRNESKKLAVLNSTVWTEIEKSEVRKLLKLINELAEQCNIELVLSYGSLLGHVRHGGIMPWDDDVDLAVNKDQKSILSIALANNKQLEFRVFYWGAEQFPYLKVWLAGSEAIPGHEHSFPFIDIWFYDTFANHIIFDDGKKYLSDEFYPFINAIFEGSVCKIPARSLKVLDKTYQDWRTKIQVYPWSHKHEKELFLPLCASISVDSEGRLAF